MIFISYNHNDEQLVDMVARRLELEFGRNNIFYDKWSIQPGDSIIGKMNEWIEKFTTFFYFLSPNSLNSKMVTKEWQSALTKSINENLKFVPVRIADCKPPAILIDSLYIDLYGAGLDDAVAQMKCVAKGNSTYKALADIENVKTIVDIVSDKLIKIEIRAMMFSENDANFAFIFNNKYEEFDVQPEDSTHYDSTGEVDGSASGIPIKLKMKTVRLFRPLTPNNAMRVTITSKGQQLQFAGIMQVLSNVQGKPVQIEQGKLSW